MEQQLIEQARRVAELRRAKADAEERYKKALHAFELANFPLLSERNQLLQATMDAELTLRGLAIMAYNETGEKRPGPGVEIKVFNSLAYDPPKAFEWALEHRIALQLNTKAFEAVVKANPQAVPFVTFAAEPRATISTDLDKALGIVTEPAPIPTEAELPF